jgi:hypothetical protein
MDQIAPKLFSTSLLFLTRLESLAHNIHATLSVIGSCSEADSHGCRTLALCYSRTTRLRLETSFCFFNFPSLSTTTSQVQLSSPSHNFQGPTRRREIRERNDRRIGHVRRGAPWQTSAWQAPASAWRRWPCKSETVLCG